jgi:hypothetical protein
LRGSVDDAGRYTFIYGGGLIIALHFKQAKDTYRCPIANGRVRLGVHGFLQINWGSEIQSHARRQPPVRPHIPPTTESHSISLIPQREMLSLDQQNNCLQISALSRLSSFSLPFSPSFTNTHHNIQYYHHAHKYKNPPLLSLHFLLPHPIPRPNPPNQRPQMGLQRVLHRTPRPHSRLLHSRQPLLIL